MTSPSGSRTIPARAMQVLSDFAPVGRFEMAIDSTALDRAYFATPLGFLACALEADTVRTT